MGSNHTFLQIIIFIFTDPGSIEEDTMDKSKEISFNDARAKILSNLDDKVSKIRTALSILNKYDTVWGIKSKYPNTKTGNTIRMIKSRIESAIGDMEKDEFLIDGNEETDFQIL